MPGQTAPQQHETSGRSLLAAVPLEKIARLAKKDGSLYLKFGSEFYHPGRDVDRLENDDRIAIISDKDGRQKRVLYLEEDKTNKVLLAEYLEAFQPLSVQGYRCGLCGEGQMNLRVFFKRAPGRGLIIGLLLVLLPQIQAGAGVWEALQNRCAPEVSL